MQKEDAVKLKGLVIFKKKKKESSKEFQKNIISALQVSKQKPRKI